VAAVRQGPKKRTPGAGARKTFATIVPTAQFVFEIMAIEKAGYPACWSIPTGGSMHPLSVQEPGERARKVYKRVGMNKKVAKRSD